MTISPMLSFTATAGRWQTRMILDNGANTGIYSILISRMVGIGYQAGSGASEQVPSPF